MGQTWTTDAFNKGHAYDTDMGNIEVNFATLKSLFSGTSQPANAVAGMPWFDTTKKVLKIRNTGNSAWYGLMHGDVSQKVWVYRDSAMDGWAVDSSVTDRVLALKGGTTYTTGAATAGSWTISFPNHAHNFATASTTGWTTLGYPLQVSSGYCYQAVSGGPGTITAVLDNTATDGASTDATMRPAAAVGVLMYLDL